MFWVLVLVRDKKINKKKPSNIFHVLKFDFQKTPRARSSGYLRVNVCCHSCEPGAQGCTERQTLQVPEIFGGL